MQNKPLDFKTVFYIILGSCLFALSVNLFLAPINIYNGGIVGISQLINSFLSSTMKIDLNLTGLLNFLLNIPLLIFAYLKMSRRFFFKTIISVLTQMIAFTLIPTLTTPITNDIFISILIAAVVGAFGCSLIFKVKSSSGGMDIIGIYQSIQNTSSVGKTYIMVNVMIYLVCAILYQVQIALYSMVYAILFSFILDRMHESNIQISVMVFTKNFQLKNSLIAEVKRGITHWDGYGLYTGEKTDVFVTVVDKAEVNHVRRIIRKHDKNAFIIISENMEVDGGFEKHLI